MIQETLEGFEEYAPAFGGIVGLQERATMNLIKSFV